MQVALLTIICKVNLEANMKKYVGIFVLLSILFFASCSTRKEDRSSKMRTLQGYVYDRISGERLKGTVILNKANDHTVITDTTGKFTLTAHMGDSLNFKYVGLKDSVIVLSKNTPSYLEVGLDTANTTLIDPDLILLKHISEADFKPFQTDNGDDYVRCDRYRIVDKTGKIGYANADGYVIIDPMFAFAFPYEKGMAKVTDKGELKEVKGSSGESHYWESDNWYYINMAGERLSSVGYSSGGIQKADSIEFVYFNNEWIRGADINMASPESITKIEIGYDEYGNKCAFVSISESGVTSIKKKIEKSLEGLWVDYQDYYCEFPGGIGKMLKWEKENIRIPDGFKGKARVVVKYFVQPDGTVSDGKIIKGHENEELNTEALRLIESMPKYEVKYYTPKKYPIPFALPIIFEAKDSL